jgi:hypothetical protein
MHPDDVVDWTIRNQRPQSWVGSFWIVGWMMFWTGALVIVELWAPYPWRGFVYPSTLVLILISFMTLVALLDGPHPIRRLRLGEDLQVVPAYRLKPADIRCIRMAADPDEDYVESKLPVPLCLVTLEGRRGRPIRLVVSVGDATRLRDWAERKGVILDDPHGYSSRGVRNGPA